MQLSALDARRVAVENALLAARETLARLDSQQPEEERAWVTYYAQLLLEHRVREKAIAAMEWNPQVAGKFLALGGQYYGDTGEADPASAQRVADFILSAIKASPASQALDAIRDRAATLMDKGEAPSSPAAQALATDLRATTARYRFGDALILAKWTVSRGKMRVGGHWVDLGERERAAWKYLGRALAEAVATA